MIEERERKSPELREYRLRARAWLADNVPLIEGGEPAKDDPRRERLGEFRALQQKMHEAGYATPRSQSSTGAGSDPRTRAGLHRGGTATTATDLGVSINILGATLVAFGTTSRSWAPAQNPVRRGALAAVSVRAERRFRPGWAPDQRDRDGDSFIVNGQKTWSTGAHLSDFALCPVRTRWDVPKHKGISVLIIDLRSPVSTSGGSNRSTAGRSSVRSSSPT